MMKWPTSHNTKSKKRSKVKNEAIWKAAAATALLYCRKSAKSALSSKQMFEKRNESRAS